MQRLKKSETNQNCGRFGHYARSCTSVTGTGFASRAPPPSRALNTSTLPPVKCYRCNGPNHLARYDIFYESYVVKGFTILIGIALLLLAQLWPTMSPLALPTSTRIRLVTSASRKAMWVVWCDFSCPYWLHQIARECSENTRDYSDTARDYSENAEYVG